MEDPWEETVDPAETASEDEVEKHVNNVLREDEYVVAQDMPDLARARMFLENGRPIQVRCALQMIPMLFAESQQELVKDLFPVFKKWLLEAPTESNVEDREELLALAGDSLCTAAETGSMPHAAASKHVWPLTKQMLESSKSEVCPNDVVRVSWRQTESGGHTPTEGGCCMWGRLSGVVRPHAPICPGVCAGPGAWPER